MTTRIETEDVVEALKRLLPVSWTNEVDPSTGEAIYANMQFGEHQTQAMSMRPDDWMLLNDLPDTIERLREENARRVDDLPDEECGICGKMRWQHNGVGTCRLYPTFRSKREMTKQWFAALTPSADDDK
jgi:hypothetical protein